MGRKDESSFEQRSSGIINARRSFHFVKWAVRNSAFAASISLQSFVLEQHDPEGGAECVACFNYDLRGSNVLIQSKVEVREGGSGKDVAAGVAIAKESAEVGGRIKLIHAFIEDLPADPKYETVLLLETLEHVIDPLPIVLKASEILAPDGRIFLSAPSTRVGTYSHVRGISVDEAIGLCHQANLSIEAAFSENWQNAYRNTYVIARHREANPGP